MLWFSGGIPEAIMSSKQRKLPFVIYVEGQDESSTSMNAVWENPKVSELFSQDKCVAIKLKNDSEECKQFSQLYPVVCVPSVFFIDQNGMPLELVGGAVGVDEFIGKTNTAYETFQKQISTVQESSQVPQQSVTADTEESTPTSTVEERVEKAKQLIEQKRKEKAEQEKQEQIEKETKRRKEGQEVTLAKQDIEDRKQKEIIKQIREDKANEKAARDAVLRQIALDKADRETRKKNELRERKVASSSSASSSAAEVPSSSKAETVHPKTTSTSTRLQFRMPDGSSEMKLFDAGAQLLVARQYIESLLESRYKSVALATIYPRRQMTEEDMSRTLSALNLVPSATLIVSPGGSPSAVVSNSSSGLSGIFMMVLAPFFTLFNFVKTFLLGGSENPRGSYGGGNSAPRREEVKQTGNSDDVRKRTGKQGFTNKEGNIHRMRNQDDDDENNTWNGNSTQQM